MIRPARGTEPLVFLSWARDPPANIARCRLEEALDAAGFEYWRGGVPGGDSGRDRWANRWVPGEDPGPARDRFLGRAHAAVAIVSPGALASEWLQDEADLLLNRAGSDPTFTLVALAAGVPVSSWIGHYERLTALAIDREIGLGEQVEEIVRRVASRGHAPIPPAGDRSADRDAIEARVPPSDERARPSAFVSYAQSSAAWQRTVLAFTMALRTCGGVDAELDLFHGADHQHWTTFGPRLIASSDFTLVAVDAAYKRRWNGVEAEGVGAGVAREAAAVRAIFERGQREALRRVKVLLLPGATENDIPADLLGFSERFRISSFDEPGLESLLRSIWERPEIPKPALGPIPALPPRAVSDLEYVEAVVMGSRPGEVDSENSGSHRGRDRERTALETSLEVLADSRGPTPSAGDLPAGSAADGSSTGGTPPSA